MKGLCKEDNQLFTELEHYSDGTTRMMCKKCKNTYRLSRLTVLAFNYCPNCGSKREVT